ncbi:related to transcriptional activator Mut3p [Cephalotrichum gorgonifer]|uniref:Related to transcriptional activator Mut3p n=1 Tax=Cephalotrichum gorgonifer TaxID=2041049 RepID=A0AAE8MSM8_9PEZI|nr:related to transcriptional activator Mut3p [Cephalotrichum gorgonifer]
MAHAIPEGNAPGPNPTPRVRPKRSQVVRACDWCRKHRVKCDNDLPCSNCKNRGGECSNGAIKAVSLPHAYRDIERLREQVRDLERQLRQERDKAAGPSNRHLPSPQSHTSLSPPDLAYGSIDSDYWHPQNFWRGIHIRTARSPQETWYGPSSLYYFVGRVTNFLNYRFQQTHSAHQMLPKTSSSVLFDGPHSARGNDPDRWPKYPVDDSIAAGVYLSPTQEEYFLDLFWQSYHTSLVPILDEAQFKEHYRSLWATPDGMRKPSALVDIVIAICMQHGLSTLPSARQKGIEDNDATIAGRWYYRRCRRLLAYEMESPTISTLQSHILCYAYLCNGSFMNMADTDCGLAVRTAYMLGLHTEPPQDMPRREKEMRKRIWWSLYVLDSKLGMKLGRPFLLQPSSAGPGLLDDGREAAMDSGSHFATPGDNTTWLTFYLHHTKLFIAARATHTSFYGRSLNIRGDQTIWDDTESLESHAEFMQPLAKSMELWVEGVPSALRTKRRDGGRPLSTDGSILEIEQFAPLWLQRQRLVLELLYHNLCTNLYRPFITFATMPNTHTLTEQMAIKCALHATTLTHIMHQVLSTTSILAGWHESFQWQWNAAITLVGFVLAYPNGTATARARNAIDMAVAVFDIFSESFAVAGGAANIVRELAAKVDFLVHQSQVEGQFAPVDVSRVRTTDRVPHINDVTGASIQDVFQMALGVDQWSDMDFLWPPGGMIPEQGPPRT